MAEEIIIEYKANIDGLKASLKSVQSELKTTEEEGKKSGKGIGDEFGKVEPKIKSLKAQLRELKAQLAVATDPKEIERLAKAAGKLTDQLQDAGDAARVFASESKFEQVGTAIGSIGSKLRNLDFKGAADQSKLLVSVIKGLTFKEVIDGVKDFGTTILNVGKALLGNPLFLLAAILVGISKAAYDVVGAMKMVDVQTKTVTEAINEQAKAIRGYADRVAEVYIKLNEGLGKYSQAQAEIKRAEIKNNQELLANKQKYSDDLVKLATELNLDLSKAQNGFFSETYKGDFEDLQNKKRFNIEKQKLDKLYHQQNMSAVKTQLLEKISIEIKANLDSIKKSQDFLNANREKQKADRQKAYEDAIAEAERLAKTLRDLETANIRSNYERRKQEILNNFADESKKYAGHLDILTQLDIQRENQLLDLYNEREKEYEKIRKDAQNKNVEIFKAGSDAMKAEDTSFAVHVKNNIEDVLKAEEAAAKKREDLNRQLLSALGTGLDTLSQLSANKTEQEIIDIDRATEKQIKSLDYQLEHKLISQETYDQKVEALEKEKDEKQRKLKKQQFETDRQIALVKAIIATAQAVITQFAETGYYGAILAGVVGAAQISIIASEPTPQFEKGGKVKGKRHKQGGTLIEAEKDEWIINRNESMKNDKLLKAINDGKGDKFIFDHYIAPSLKAQQKKNAEGKEKSFASNLANSMNLNFKDSNLLDSLKQSRKNDKEIAQFIVKNLKANEKDARRF